MVLGLIPLMVLGLIALTMLFLELIAQMLVLGLMALRIDQMMVLGLMALQIAQMMVLGLMALGLMLWLAPIQQVAALEVEVVVKVAPCRRAFSNCLS